MTYLGLALQLAMVGVFAVSAVTKLRVRAEAEAAIALLLRLPQSRRAVVTVVTSLLIVAELTIAVAMLVPRVSPAAQVSAIGLLVVLTLGVATAVKQKISVPCACFGRPTSDLGKRHIYRNLILIAIAGTGLVTHVFQAAGSLSDLHVGGVAMSVLGAFVIALLVTYYDEIVDLFDTSPGSGVDAPSL
ncbi:MauE/DoxX family redox-associated membrane protein [Micromonospora sp. NBC_01813]|uniref:MauE/DoxX family redox-associated membrane protein n=1 Tax=Micromonospora sp. NBC_01813 TaxID=2975988 RepID=UPI002DDAA8CA|nr:MauE/DoxX family redox-associated membrane protein [Micromonospora sp. NBC_01813]WSA06705.1 hypothetical protein OG958_20725 [Micromonospora sp. NBC_01813]